MIFIENFLGADSKAVAFLGAVLDAIPQEAALIERGGRIVGVNARWARSLGANGDALEVGGNLLDLFRRRVADDPEIRRLLEGLEAVLSGARDAFSARILRERHPVSIEARALSSGFDGALMLKSVPARLEDPCDPGEETVAETALRESERRERRRSAELQALFDAAPIGLAIALDPQGAQMQGNRALAQIFGAAPAGESSKGAEEPPGFRVFRNGRELEARALPMPRASAGQAVGGELLDILREDGRTITAFVKATPLYDEAGVPRGAVGAFMDVTRIRRAELASRECEQRFRSFVEAYAQAVWEADSEGVVVKDSPSWRAYTGQSREEWLDDGWVGAIHSDDRADAEREWRDAVGSRKNLDAEFRLKHGDGWRWTNVRATPIRSPDGGVAKWIGMNIDIEARKQAEAALRDSEAQFRAMFELTGVGMAQADVATGRLLRVNEAFAHMLGYERAELLGTPFPEITHPEDRAADWERFARMARGDATLYDTEKRYVRKDGSIFWGRVTATLTGPPGEAVRTVAVIQDITHQKQIETLLRESEARLEQALAAANAGVWEFVPETGAFKASARAVALHGLAPDGPIDRGRALSAIYPEDRPCVEAALQHSIETGAPFEVEFRARQPDGSLRWLSSVADVCGDGEDLRFVGLVQGIDERKRNEMALRESEERQAFLLKLTDNLRQIVDPGEIQAAACRLLGEHLGVNRVAYADIIGDEFIVRHGYANGVAPFMVRMPIADLGAKFIECYRRGESVAIEDVFAEAGFTPAERERFEAGEIRALASVILTKQGRWVGTLCAHNAAPRAWTSLEIGLVREVAERVWSSAERARVQAALRESEFRLQLALNSGNIGIYEESVETGELIWDDRLRALWGLPSDAPVSHALFMEGVHPADRERVRNAIDRAVDPRGSGSVSVEYRVVSLSDRAERWVAATGTVFFEDDRPVRIVGTSQDITARKRAEAERQKFVALAEQSLEFIGLCNLDFAPLYINPAGARLVGLERERASSTPIAEFFFPEDCNYVFTEFHDRVRRDGHANVEIRFRHFQTGEALWMLYNVFVLRDQHNEPIGFATVSRDITERKRAEDALKAADRRKDEFLATLAHELRNPLAPIRNAVHVLRHDAAATTMGERDLALLAMIDRQVEHLIRLVDDLLEVSRITRGKIELKKRRVDLAEILRHAVETAQPTIDRAQHRLHVSLPSEPLALDVDPVRLAQVFTNLLNNAAKYTEHGGDIWLMVERRESEAVVAVRDSGVGIPAEMLPRVFDLFTQVDRTLGRAQGGLGIGLALVKSLLDLHGGAVEAQSEGLGCGSSFMVRLPMLPTKDTEEPMPATAPTEFSATRRILVIDDDHDVADSLVMFLETFGATVRAVYSGAAGLEAVPAFKPDLIFLDLGMPGMDGYETARRIRALPEGRDVKLVALTGWGQEQVNDRAREAGFDRQLTKPAGFEALQELLGAA
ncbi:PAS domain S-box protein [Methylocystis sp. S23]